MLEAIRRLIQDVAGGLQEERAYAADDPKVAAAALLVHAISIDGAVEPEERERLSRVLSSRYGLGAEETRELIEQAGRRDSEAVDLYQFTSLLKRRLDADGRRQVISMMWEMALADGALHELEDNLIWRVAELLGVSTRERVRLRKEVEARRGVQ